MASTREPSGRCPSRMGQSAESGLPTNCARFLSAASSAARDGNWASARWRRPRASKNTSSGPLTRISLTPGSSSSGLSGSSTVSRVCS